MKVGRLCAAPVALVLISCGTPEIIRFPAESQSAKLRYISTAAHSDSTYLWRVDRSQCPVSTKRMLIAMTGTKETSQIAMIGSSPEPQGLIRELNVPASEPLTFHVWASGYPTYSCDNAGVFQPRPGREYELRHVIEPSTSRCIVQIDELQLGTDGQVKRQRESSAHYFHPPKKEKDYCGEAPRAN